ILALVPGGLQARTGIGPHAGLALAIGVGACMNAGLLYRKLRQHAIYAPQPGWGIFALKVAAAVAIMALALCLAMGEEQWWLSGRSWSKAAAMSGLVLLGSLSYFFCLWLLGFRVSDFSRRAA